MSDDHTESSPTKIAPLTEQNYQQWKFSMRAVLMIKGMCWFVCTGVYVHPGETAGAAEVNKWGIANMQACGLIYNSVSPSIQPFVQELMDSAKGMWDALAEKFEQQNSTARFITVNNLLSVQKQPDELLSSLIGRVDSYLQAL